MSAENLKCGHPWGALGGAAPDIENALDRFGLCDGAGPVFPTHRGWHGAARDEAVSQAALGVLCWALLRRRAVDKRGASPIE